MFDSAIGSRPPDDATFSAWPWFALALLGLAALCVWIALPNRREMTLFCSRPCALDVDRAAFLCEVMEIEAVCGSDEALDSLFRSLEGVDGGHSYACNDALLACQQRISSARWQAALVRASAEARRRAALIRSS